MYDGIIVRPVSFTSNEITWYQRSSLRCVMKTHYSNNRSSEPCTELGDSSWEIERSRKTLAERRVSLEPE